MQQALANLRIAAPGPLVGQHHLADRQAGLGTVLEQGRGRGERVLQRRFVLDDPVRAGRLLVDHKTAAHRVIGAFPQRLTLRIQRTEYHAVGVIRQHLAPVEDQVPVDIEGQFSPVGQWQPAAAAYLFQSRGYRAGIDRFRRLAGQPQDDCLVRTVPLAGRAQRPVQLHLQPGQALIVAGLRQIGDKHGRGTHGPHRVRAGRPDADLEKFEYADCHACPLRGEGCYPGVCYCSRLIYSLVIHGYTRPDGISSCEKTRHT